MTLIACPVCAGQVSQEAFSCPHCGHPLRPVPVPTGAPAPRLSAATTNAVRVFMVLGGVLAVAAAVTRYDFGQKVSAWLDREGQVLLGAALRAEERADTVAGLAFLAGFVLWILLIVWGNKAYHDVRSRGATGMSWSPGWAVGGWFIPLGNAIIPKLVLGEVDRMSHPDAAPAPIGDRWRGLRVIAAGTWWWVLTVVGLVAVTGGISLTEDSVTWDDFSSGIWVASAGWVLVAVGQVFGFRYVTTLGERIHPASR